MTGLNWKSADFSAVIHPYLRERDMRRNGTRGAKYFKWPVCLRQTGHFFCVTKKLVEELARLRLAEGVQGANAEGEIIAGSTGRYLMGESIGRGGLGDVFRAQDTQLHRPVAIKRLHTKEETPGKFMQEARHLAALQHPNIVTVYDFIEAQDEIVVVMELLRGRTLQDIAEAAPLLEADFLSAMRQTLEGLIAAHAIGMLHRDIKPSNLMIIDLPSGAFQVKILDFGLAKIAPEPSHQTTDQNNSLLGSVYTMSPEQFENKPIDARSDLYSLGCVAYFALTGYYPFSGTTVPEVICAHLQQKVTPLEQMRPDISTNICQWVRRMMSLDPADRPTTAAQAMSGLNLGTTSTVPVQVRAPAPEPVPEKVAPPAAKSSAPLFLGLAVAVIAIAAAAVFILRPELFHPKAAAPEPVAAQPKPAEAVPTKPTPTVFSPTDKAGLIAQANKPVVVEGEIQRQGVTKTGSVRFLNFAGTQRGDLSLVFFTKGGAEDVSEAHLNQYIGKKVRVSGEITLYNGEPQLVIKSFSQIQSL